MGKSAQKAATGTADAQLALANRTADIGEGLLKEAQPARETAQNAYLAVAGGDPTKTAQFSAPSLNAITRNYAAASKSLDNMPMGGAKDRAQRSLITGQASDRSNVLTGGVQEALARLASMGMGGTQTGVGAYGQASSGMGQAGQTYSNLSSAKGQSAGSAAGGLGTVAGLFL